MRGIEEMDKYLNSMQQEHKSEEKNTEELLKMMTETMSSMGNSFKNLEEVVVAMQKPQDKDKDKGEDE